MRMSTLYTLTIRTLNPVVIPMVNQWNVVQWYVLDFTPLFLPGSRWSIMTLLTLLQKMAEWSYKNHNLQNFNHMHLSTPIFTISVSLLIKLCHFRLTAVAGLGQVAVNNTITLTWIKINWFISCFFIVQISRLIS